MRQPIARASAYVRTGLEKQALLKLADQVQDEINAKALEVHVIREFLQAAGEHFDKVAAYLTEYDASAEDDAGYTVAVDTRITPELADEGLARELVHRIQNLRKTAGFEISDHIVTYYQGSPRLRTVLQKHGDYVRQETLSEELMEGPPPEGAHAEEQKLDGEPVTLAVARR